MKTVLEFTLSKTSVLLNQSLKFNRQITYAFDLLIMFFVLSAVYRFVMN